MDYVALLKTLEAFTISDFVRTSPWAYPILEIIHMFGLGLIFGGVFAFDLRLFGVHRTLSIEALAHHILPWVWIGFLINLTSGILLFLSDAVTFGLNLAFQIKIVLLALTGLTVFWFQRAVFPHLADWDRSGAAPTSAKVLAVLSITLWMGIITAGRMIAYVPEPDIEEAVSASAVTPVLSVRAPRRISHQIENSHHAGPYPISAVSAHKQRSGLRFLGCAT